MAQNRSLTNEDIKENDFESYGSETTLGETFQSSQQSDESEEREKVSEDDGPVAVYITQEHLRKVQQELCLIKLCWPEVDIRKDLYLKALPDSYFTVSGKERLLAWYAENFRQQYRAKFPERKPLLLMCENECGVQKFVSTTIRRSTLPYPELYTWQGCGKFVSDYIEYEPLDKPLGMPRHLRSPTWMLQFQKGNCFEYATFLTSLLLGQGYNAFVVSGYASREQTLRDTTRTPYPELLEPIRPQSVSVPVDTSKYQFKPPPDFISQFLLELEAKREEKIELEMQKREKEQKRITREFEKPLVDEYRGHRIHAWVVVLPEERGLRHQEIFEPFFIEPSTGVHYKPGDRKTSLLYLGVESVWNDQNYWVNKQSRSEGCAAIKWDLISTELWEHLLPGEPWTTRGTTDDIDDDISILQEKHLDMPFSYVDEICIPEIDYERRYPNGRKTMFYKKTKVELYAPYLQTDGMIQRITTYEDYLYANPFKVQEIYANRSDKLVESRRNLNDDSVIDYYARGRPDQCKEHRYFASTNGTVDSERILDFYDAARFDGLSQIEMHPSYLTQHFINRDDFLYYRHVQFNLEQSIPLPNDIHYRLISKIVEKYHRDEKIEAPKNIAIREFNIGENEIRLTFHYNPGQCSRGTRSYVKPPLAERGDRLVLNPTMTQGYNPDPFDQTEKSLDLFYQLEEQLKEEDICISYVRAAEVEVFSFLKTQSTEYLAPELLISVFDRHRGLESQMEVYAMEEEIRAQSERDLVEELDCLRPYFARIGYPETISITEAHALREECLNDYKALLVRRANNILEKFEECTRELGKLQILLTQTEDLAREDEEQILEKTNEINFHLHTLEVRLNRHRDLVPGRYKMLVDHLEQNPRLSILRQ